MSSSKDDNSSTNSFLDDENEIFYKIPIHLSLEYLTLKNILSARLSCRAMAEATDDISPHRCFEILLSFAREKNIYFLQTDQNKKKSSITNIADEDFLFESIFHLRHLGKSQLLSTPSSAFDQMMKCIRTFKYLPNEFTTVRSSKYGLCCQGIQSHLNFNDGFYLNMNDNSKSNDRIHFPYHKVSKLQQYSPCHRGYEQCPSCQYNIPYLPKCTEEQKNQHGKNHDKIDFDTVYNKCVPNIPSNLKCPICLDSNRTLQLIFEHYRSSSVSIRNDATTLLTYNPIDTDDLDNITNDDDTHNSRKYIIGMVCTTCQKFKIIKPSSPCTSNSCEIYDITNIDQNSQCPLSNKISKSQRPTYVAVKCANTHCYHPVHCQSCTGKQTIQIKSLFSKFSTCEISKFCCSCSKRLCISCCDESMNKVTNMRTGKIIANIRMNNEKRTLDRFCDDCYQQIISSERQQLTRIKEKKEKKKKTKKKKKKKRDVSCNNKDVSDRPPKKCKWGRCRSNRKIRITESRFPNDIDNSLLEQNFDNDSEEEENLQANYNSEYENELMGYDEHDITADHENDDPYDELEENKEWDYCD